MAPMEVLASVELRHPFLGQHSLSALRPGEQAAPPPGFQKEGDGTKDLSDFPPWALGLGRLPLARDLA